MRRQKNHSWMFKPLFRHFLLVNLLLWGVNTFAQDRISFDSNGRKSAESLALYYRSARPDSDGLHRAYYINGDALYFEGKIIKTDNLIENNNLYAGNCTWYYKNGHRKAVRRYTANGLQEGLEESYYENGKIKKEVNFKAGQIARGPYFEYNDTGQKTNVLEENFEDNYNDWDLYKSMASTSRISNNTLEIKALTKEGTSRFIAFPKTGDVFSFEVEIENKTEKKDKYGLILGFKDWENFTYFLIKDNYFYIGTVFEGLKVEYSDGSYAGAIKTDDKNSLKVLSTGEKTIFSVNGEMVFRKEISFVGNKYGILAGDKQHVLAHKITWKEFDTGSASTTNDQNVKSIGTGFFISPDGLLATNYHVVENSNKLVIEMLRDGVSASYIAKVVQVDKANDLAVIKIDDPSFTPLAKLPYRIKSSGLAEVGSSVFTLGFPFALMGMGKEVKFSDGKVSSKTGYNQDINSYQTTVPVQPGNSGGPLFDQNGQLIGIINAKFKQGDNVSYAIKSNYLVNLLDLVTEKSSLPNYQYPPNTTTETMVKEISTLVVLIKVK